MNESESAIFKQALAAAPRALAAPVKIWRTLNFPTPAAAVNFVNAPPAQVAGEAVFSDLPNGTVQTYYFL
jgi:hypothetical protein